MRTVEPDAGETRRRGAQTDQRYDPILTDTLFEARELINACLHP